MDESSSSEEESDCDVGMSENNIWSSDHDLVRRASLCSKIYEYFKKGIYTDVDIVCEDGRTFKCHRLALAAASAYFHRTFAENSAPDVVLHDIDSDTFEQILLYVYSGEVAAINDENVFSLLRASDILKLSDIEDHCVHYLTQKNIPKDDALKIYLFASAERKVSLIPATSQFILQHLEHFSRESLFWNMSVENFNTLLGFFQAKSASREERLLDVMLQWVRLSTNVGENNRKSSFLELAQNVQFKFVSATHVSEYFDKNFSIDDVSRCCEALDLHSNSSSSEIEDESLYVYVRTDLEKPSGREDDDPLVSQTRIFSLRESGKRSIEWHSRYTISPAFQMVRTIESAGQLYSLKSFKRVWSFETVWSFSRYTSIDLSTDSQTLVLPLGLLSTDVDNYNFVNTSLCCVQKDIYLNLSRLVDVGFQCYHTEVDAWSPVPVVSEKCEPKIVMSDGARLYIVGNKTNDGPYYLAAYDPRAGKLDELNNGGGILDLSGICTQPGCFHKGKMYVPEDYFDEGYPSTPRMAIYDPTAGRWSVQNLKPDHTNYASGRRLLSFNDRLWMFGFGNGYLFAQTYDSYLEKWRRLNPPMMFDNETNGSYLSFADVIAFKSL